MEGRRSGEKTGGIERVIFGATIKVSSTALTIGSGPRAPNKTKTVVGYVASVPVSPRERIPARRSLHCHQLYVLFLLPLLACTPLQLGQQIVAELLAAPHAVG